MLFLDHNKISNIDILEYVNFKELKELNFSNNEIEDIEVLKKVKFEKLEKLDLSHNEDSFEFSPIIQALKQKIKIDA